MVDKIYYVDRNGGITLKEPDAVSYQVVWSEQGREHIKPAPTLEIARGMAKCLTMMGFDVTFERV